MTLQGLQQRLEGPEERLARMRKRLRASSRRASRVAHGKGRPALTQSLGLLLVSAACIGAAVFALAEAVLKPLLLS